MELAIYNPCIVPPDTLDCSIQEFVDLYLDDIKLKDESKKTYKKVLYKFVEWANANGITCPKQSDIIAYRDSLATQYKPRTVNSYLGHVKMLFHWGSYTKKYRNVAHKVRLVRVKDWWRGEKDPLTREQAKSVLQEARKDLSEAGLRNYALLVTLFCTGIRTIEARRADIEDIKEIDGERVIYIQGKGHKEKDSFCELPNVCYDALQEYISARKATKKDPLFAAVSNRNHGGRLSTVSISQIVKKAFLAVGLDSERLTAHSTRYTAINLIVDYLGGPSCPKAFTVAKTLARHADESSTIYYYNWSRKPRTEEEILESQAKCQREICKLIFGEKD